MFLLVPAHPGSPGQRAIKRSFLLLLATKSRVAIVVSVQLGLECERVLSVQLVT